jgi:hypothetical protein
MLLLKLTEKLFAVLQSYPPSHAIAGCLLCTGSYVGFLMVWRGLPRNHPKTIKRRMLSVGAACSVTWLPLYLAHPEVRMVPLPPMSKR